MSVGTEKPKQYIFDSLPELQIIIKDKPSAFAKAAQEINSLGLTSDDLDNINKHQNIYLRKLYAKRTFWLVCLWLASVTFTIYLDGLKLHNFNLPTSVLLMLLGTTTVDIAGFLVIIFGYLFKD